MYGCFFSHLSLFYILKCYNCREQIYNFIKIKMYRGILRYIFRYKNISLKINRQNKIR